MIVTALQPFNEVQGIQIRFFSLPSRLLRMAGFLLDRADTALSAEQIRLILRMLNKQAIGYVFISQDHLPPDLYDSVLEIDETGGWNWKVLPASQTGSTS